jgi:SPP1 gp7 family putative phage head morphogenesis protein
MNQYGFASMLSGMKHAPALTRDINWSKWGTKAQRRAASAYFQKVRNAERNYAIQLRKIARHVGEIIRHYSVGDPAVIPEIVNTLSRYAEVITPWASATAARMIAEVSRRDEQAWFRTSQNIGRDLRKEIRDAPVGAVMRQLHQDQVHLITSIPLEAAKRVQELTQEYLVSGRRYEDLVPMVMNTTGVTLSRATLIARTETSKAASALVQARALHIGSTHYVWHTVQDIYVRKTHRELNGTTQSWTDPPIAEENGERHHPGAFPNCRCFSVPVLSDVIE